MVKRLQHGKTCRNTGCEFQREGHDGDDEGCPKLPGKTFLGHVPRSGASQSFSDGEIAIADMIIRTLLRGGDPHIVTRHPEFANFARKVQGMKAAAARRKAGK